MTRDKSASTTFAVGGAGAASLIYVSAATVAATSETTAGPTVFGYFMRGSFVARAWLGAMASLNVEAAACSADPVDLRIGRRRRNLEIPFGHAIDKREVSLPKRAVRVRPLNLRSAIEANRTRGATVGHRRMGHFKPALGRTMQDVVFDLPLSLPHPDVAGRPRRSAGRDKPSEPCVWTNGDRV